MNKRVLAVLLAALVLLAAGFSMVLFWEQQEMSALEELCQTSAYAALEEFREFAATGKEHHYWYGVAEYRSFMKAYLFLNENVSGGEYTWCNSVYGYLVLYPETVKPHMERLTDALEYLARDYDDPNGFMRISELNNELIHGDR